MVARVSALAPAPAPASAEDWINFDADAQQLADALRAQRLTILVSAAGVGKTTLLVDGLLPLLRLRPAEVVYFVDLWSPSQLDSLQRELGDDPTGERVSLGPAEAMSAPRLSAISQRLGGARLLFVLDHFDWLLAGAEHDPALQRFVDAWASALHAPDLDAHFLIAVDERAWQRMGALRARIAQVTQDAFALLARPGGRLLEPLVLDRQAEDAQAPEVSDADFLASFNECLKRVAKPPRHGPRLEDFANSLNAIASQASTAARAASWAEARRTASAVEAVRQADAERGAHASAHEAEQRASAERLAEAQELKQALACAEAAAQAAQAAQAERHAAVESARIAEANRLAQALACAEAAAQAAQVEQRAQAERLAAVESARDAEASRLAQALACAEAAAQAALVKQHADAERHAKAEAERIAEANRLAQALAAAEAAALREAQARHAAEAEIAKQSARAAAQASAHRASEAQAMARAAVASAAPAKPQPIPPTTPAAPAATAAATRILVPAAAAARPARTSPPWGAALLAVAAVLVLWWWSTRPTRQVQQPTVAPAVTAAPAAAPSLKVSSTSVPASEPTAEIERYAMLIPTAAYSHGTIERELAAALSTPPAAMQLVAAADGSGLIGGLQAPGRLAIAHFDALRAVHGNAAAPLRVLTPLFPVEVLFIVRADSPIKHIHDLRGKRINIGPTQGDGSHTVREIYRRLTGTEMAAPAQHDNDQALAELVGFGSIDAMAIVEPQPSAWWASLAPGTARRLRLLTLDLSNEADHRMLKAPGTSQSRAGATATRENTTTTLAVMSYLVTSGEGDADSEQLTAMAQALCRELPRLREQGHPKWRELQPAAQFDTGSPVVRAFQSVLSRCARR